MLTGYGFIDWVSGAKFLTDVLSEDLANPIVVLVGLILMLPGLVYAVKHNEKEPGPGEI